MAPPTVDGWQAPQQAPQPIDSVPVGPDQWQQMAPMVPGFKVGAATVIPSVTAAGFYDDNIYASSTNRRGSFGAIVRPELGAVATGSTYTVEARGNLERKWYSSFADEGYTNGAAGVAATVMPDSNTQIVGKARYARGHEDRGGGESQISRFDAPLGNNTWEASGALNKRFGRFWTSLGVAVSWSDYDTPTIGGIPVDQSYRDGNVGVLSGRFGYVVAPLTSVFIEGAVNRRKFELDTFSSRGYRLVAGVLLEPGEGSRLRGEAFAGFMNQNYNGTSFTDNATFTFGGSLAYLLTPRLTAVAEGRRNSLESALNGGVSLVETTAAARLDFAITTNFLIGAGASYLVDKFSGVDRTDHAISPVISAKYFVNPFITVGLDYRNVTFGSEGAGVPSFYRNVYLLSINGKI